MRRASKFLLSCCLMASTSAIAGQSIGKVTKLSIREGLVYFALSGAPTGRPGCASATDYFMIKNENSAVGKQQMALVLAAMSTDRQLWAQGSNECTKWGDGEDLRELTLVN